MEKKYYTSAWLLEHSLQDNPEDVYRGNDSRIAYLINHSDVFSEKVQEAIDREKGKNKIGSDINLTFDTGDLAYSIHKAKIQLDGYKQNHGKWLIHCTLNDVYDYTKLFTLMNDKGMDISTVANDLAYISQHTGALSPYKITVDFYITR